MKSVYKLMTETNVQEVGLALMYIEFENSMCREMRTKNDTEVARLEGLMKGILIAARMLGVNDFYGKTITNLRNAIQNEEKLNQDLCD